MNSCANPLVSVVIPVYNVIHYLAECVESVIDQSYSNLEIILVDDGSTDGSGALCDAYAKRDPRIRVIHQANSGQGKARNVGTYSSKGEYITYVDSDDEIDKYMIEKLWEIAVANKGYISSCSLSVFLEDENPQFDLLHGNIHLVDAKTAVEYLMYQVGLFETGPCGKLFSTKMIFENRIQFPNTFYEDLATVYKLFQSSAGVAYTTGKGYGYRQRKNSTMRGGFTIRKGRDILTVCKNLMDEYNHAPLRDRKMVQCRCFSAVANVFLTIPDGEFHQVEKEMWNAIKRYRRGLVFNNKARKKNRIGALISYLGKKLMKRIYYFYLK